MFGYERWENFEKVIYRSMESCEASGIAVLDYFREVTKMITIGKGRKREVISLYKPESRQADMNRLASMSGKRMGTNHKIKQQHQTEKGGKLCSIADLVKQN